MKWNTAANWDQPLSRRAALRGAGAVLALPFLESWGVKLARGAGESTKAVKPPLRMAIYSVTGGTVVESWRMPRGGALPAKLPSILRPLEFARKDLLVVTGLSHSGDGEGVNAHEFCSYKHLTGATKVGKTSGKPFAGISVDQVAARHVGGETFLPSLEFGLATGENLYSFRSVDDVVASEMDPRQVFARLFRGRSPVVPNWTTRAQARAVQAIRLSANKSDHADRSVVDAVREEAKSLRGKVAEGDRQKLDQYLDSVRSVETRIERLEARLQLEAADAKKPGPSKLSLPALPGQEIPFYKLRDQVYRDPEKHAEYIRTMSDLLVLAFQTDSTRVATLALGADDGHFPGVVTVGYETHCHTLEHLGNADKPANADPIAREACRQIHAWYTSLFAETVRKMQAIDEGGSTLLDNTMLLYTSYMADGGHGTNDYPAMLVGNAQGTLTTGRQYDAPAKTPVSNLYVEMLTRMGAEADGFGDSLTSRNRQFDGRLPGLSS